MFQRKERPGSLGFDHRIVEQDGIRKIDAVLEWIRHWAKNWSL